MFVDSSAFMAILLGEADAMDLLLRLRETRQDAVTTPIVRYEVVVSLARSRAENRPVTQEDIDLATERFDTLLRLLGCTEVALTPEIGRLAVAAAALYGKVAGHPARLNMGDCMSYAAAKSGGLPLLYKGDVFAQTDLA